MPAAIPLTPAILPVSAINMTAAIPISAPPASEANGVKAVPILTIWNLPRQFSKRSPDEQSGIGPHLARLVAGLIGLPITHKEARGGRFYSAACALTSADT
jgi:hypothetical protein